MTSGFRVLVLRTQRLGCGHVWGKRVWGFMLRSRVEVEMFVNSSFPRAPKTLNGNRRPSILNLKP